MAGAAGASSGTRGSFGRGGDELLVGINVTPLVDVVLVLLVVLMVTASYVAAQSLPLELPHAKTGEAEGGVLRISITAAGAVHLDERAVGDAELQQLARAASAKDPKSRAVIAADGGTRHRVVVRVVDLLRQSGVHHFAINVQRADHALLE